MLAPLTLIPGLADSSECNVFRSSILQPGKGIVGLLQMQEVEDILTLAVIVRSCSVPIDMHSGGLLYTLWFPTC